MTTAHPTDAGPPPATTTTPDHSPEDAPAPAPLRSPATPQHDGGNTRTFPPAGRPIRMDLELASRLLASSRWLQ